MTTLDHLLALVIVVLVPLYSRHEYPKDRKRIEEGGSRVTLYRQTRRILISLCAVTLLLWFAMGRSATDLGLGLEVSAGTLWSFLATAILCALLAWNLSRFLRSDETPDLGSQIHNLAPLIPRNPIERRSYNGVAWTAGICEEIVFRGYLIWYFSQFAPLPWAVLLSSLAFGLAHSYQGLWPNVLTTGSVGLVAALLYVFSGSLWLAMAFHVYLDLNQGRMMSAVLERAGEADPAGIAEVG